MSIFSYNKAILQKNEHWIAFQSQNCNKILHSRQREEQRSDWKIIQINVKIIFVALRSLNSKKISIESKISLIILAKFQQIQFKATFQTSLYLNPMNTYAIRHSQGVRPKPRVVEKFEQTPSCRRSRYTLARWRAKCAHNFVITFWRFSRVFVGFNHN